MEKRIEWGLVPGYPRRGVAGLREMAPFSLYRFVASCGITIPLYARQITRELCTEVNGWEVRLRIKLLTI